MTRIAIVGPGAIGSVVAALLVRAARHELVLAARTRFTRLVVETPEGVIEAEPRVLTEIERAEPVDWVLVTTKAYDAAGAARWFPRLCAPSTRVAVLQNGVEHVERFARFVPVERIVPVIVDCPAERSAPGRARLRRRGRLIVPDGAPGARFVELFAGCGLDVRQSSRFRSELWRKLCVNSAGALSAITLRSMSIAAHAPIADALRGVIGECIEVARAEGADLDVGLVDELIRGFAETPPDTINSLHADRIAGRRMEIDARNGVIVRLGKKHGISTPHNALIVALLQAIEADR